MTISPVVKELPDVISFLEEIELDRDRLIDVVRYADAERALCTANDRKGWPLIVTSNKAARALREQFCGERWVSDETDNQAGIFNPHKKVRIITCNFDKNAGNPAKNPANRTEKGAASEAKTRGNETAWFPGFEPPTSASDDDVATYVLGIYSEDDEPLRAELSRPKAFEAGDFVKFMPRIILLDGTEDQGDRIRPSADRDGPTEVIDIEIRRA
jgi:hypothetical protein